MDRLAHLPSRNIASNLSCPATRHGPGSCSKPAQPSGFDPEEFLPRYATRDQRILEWGENSSGRAEGSRKDHRTRLHGPPDHGKPGIQDYTIFHQRRGRWVERGNSMEHRRLELHRVVLRLRAAIVVFVFLLFGLLPHGEAFAASIRLSTQSPVHAIPSEAQQHQWFYGQRSPSGGVNVAAAYAQALRQAHALPRAASVFPGAPQASGSTGGTWVNLGPSPVQNDYWSGPGPASGRISSIALAPNGAIYVGSASGGVWDSTNGGTSWTPLTDHAPSLAMGALAIDPSNSSIIYAGTGEAHASNDSFYGEGLLKSTNGGVTWTDLGVNVFGGYHISAVVIDPKNTSTVYVAGTMGLYESTNGGTSWTNLTPNLQIPNGTKVDYSISALVLNPTSLELFAAIPGVGIESSTDGGSTWSLLSGGLPASGSAFGNTVVALAPSNPSVMYASISDKTGFLTGLYQSTNGGNTWTALSGIPDYFSQSYSLGSGTGAQGWYDNTVAVDPKSPNTVTVGGIALVQITSAGQSGQTVTNLSQQDGIHPDNHALVYDSAGNLYVGNDGGIWEVTAGGTPLDLNTNLSINQVYPGFAVSQNGSEVVAGSQDNGTNVYTGSPAWNQILPGDGGMAAIDPSNPAILYATADQNILQSTDGGQNWNSPITPPFNGTPNWVVPLVMDPTNPQVLYTGAGNVWATTDGGAQWTPLPTGVSTSSNETVSAIAVAPSNPKVLYAGWSSGRLEMSTDSGTTWRTISPGVNRWITGITVSSTNPYQVYVTLSGYSFPQSIPSSPHVLETPNANASIPGWTDLTGNLPNAPVNALVQDGSALIVASDVGVFMTTNNGQSWSALGQGLPNVQVVDLKLTPNGTLYAATHGRGVWTIPVGAPAQTATTVSGISPSSGSPNGGKTVTITGSGFTGATAVNFGLIPAASFTVVSDTQITAVAPPGGGMVDVTVTGASGTSALNSADRFTYTGTPVLDPLSPATGPVGTTVTLTGSGFGSQVSGDEVFIGSSTANVTSWTANRITATVPGGLVQGTGTFPVAVVNAGTGLSNWENFTITPGAVITSLSASVGQTGTPLTLQGAGFGTVAGAVYFSDGPGSPVKVPVSGSAWSDTSITVNVPATLASGIDSVTAYNALTGYSNAVPFTVYGPPAALTITPTPASSIPVGGSVTLNGIVTDQNQFPVPGAEVYLSDSGGGTVTPVAVPTLPDGSFTATFDAPSTVASATVTAVVYGASGQPIKQTVPIDVVAPVNSGNSNTGGGGGGGGGGGFFTPTPPAPASSTASGTGTVTVGSSGPTTVTSSDHTVSITVPQGGLPTGTRITLQLPATASLTASLPASESFVGSVVTISDGGVALHQAAGATFGYNPADLNGLSPNRVAVYYLNPATGSWDYVGGMVNETSHTVSVALPHFSTYAVLINTTQFGDVTQVPWARKAIDTLLGANLIQGVAPGEFAPQENLTRAQLVTLLDRLVGAAPANTGGTPFTDVNPSAWYAPYVAAGYQAGLIQGTSATTFSPNAPVTREEAAVLAVRVLNQLHLTGLVGAQPAAPQTFVDQSQIAPWAQKAVTTAAGAGLVQGFPNGTFQPEGLLSRAQGAVILERLLMEKQASLQPPPA